MNRIGVTCLVLTMLLAISGCSGGAATYPVTGKVTVGGKPAPENTRINFAPVGEGIAASGIIDAQGNYTLFSGSDGKDGAVPGQYKIYFTPDASSASYMDSPQRGGVPGVVTGPFSKEYTSEITTPLVRGVDKGPNTLDFEIP